MFDFKEWALNNSDKLNLVEWLDETAPSELEAANKRIEDLEAGLKSLYKDSMASDFNEHWDSYLKAGELLNKQP